MKKRLRFIMVGGLFVALSAACASTPDRRSLGEVIDDSLLSARVKSKLLANKTVKGLHINVDARKGQVTLRGKVHSQAEYDALMEAVRGVKGVKGVEPKITLVSHSQGRVDEVDEKESPAEPAAPESEDGLGEQEPKPEKQEQGKQKKEKKKKEKRSKHDVHERDLGESVKEDTDFWTRTPGSPGTTPTPRGEGE